MKKNRCSESGLFNRRTVTSLLFFLAGLLMLGFLALGQSRPGIGPVSSGEAPAHSATSETRVAVGPVYSQIPSLTPEQIRAREEELKEVNKLPPLPGPSINSPPSNPPTEPASNIAAPKSGPNAPNDFTYQVVHDLSPSEAGNDRNIINEPSVASMGNTIFYTGNVYAARSTNGGQSFTYVNPYTTFPSVNGGFCCDQAVNYAPAQDMMIWALQYYKDSNSGTLRIAHAVGSAAVANNTWFYNDFKPQDMGFAIGDWFDFPSITVSDNYLYVTSNVAPTSGNYVIGCAIWRIALSDLAAGGNFTYRYFTRTDINSLRPTDGAHTTMYWAALNSTSQVRIHRWDDDSNTIYWDNVNISSFSWLNRDGYAPSPDGSNWAARADSRILGSWVANGVIGLMWGAKQGGFFPYPYTIVARFNQSNRALISQNQIYNPQFAWLYPTASVNAARNLAGLLAYGGGPYYPGSNLWVSDDVQNGFNPLATYASTASNIGPSSNVWGDYHTVHRHKDFLNTWVVSAYSVNNSSSNVVSRYSWVGRQRDFGNKWRLAAVGDFNGDSKPDYVLFNIITRQTAIWYMNNNILVSGAYGPTLPAPWSLVAVGDFNSDSKPDYVLFNTITRQTAIWYMNNNILVGGAYGPTLPSGWNLLAVSDFNGDSKPDYVLWNPSTRQTVIYYMNNNILVGGAYGPTLPSGWNLLAVGDFNGDSKPDYVLFNPSTRQTAIWYMNNNILVGGAYGPTLPSGWNLLAVGDFNGDSRPDYVFDNFNTSETAIWYMNNNVFVSGAFGPTLPP